MCCFTGPVDDVKTTRIFARGLENGRQVLVYQMRYETKQPVAMILPLPVPARSMEEDVQWINLENYSSFFQDMEDGFDLDIPGSAGTLKVYDVGRFHASFAPTVDAMDRLPELFRLPKEIWKKQLPQYRDYGFAVFQLKETGNREVHHPMAFTFPRAKPEQVFFPTVHIHDGKVHEKADFDHILYLQKSEANSPRLSKWQESPQPAGTFMKGDRVKEASLLLDSSKHVYRIPFHGSYKNVDIVV